MHSPKWLLDCEDDPENSYLKNVSIKDRVSSNALSNLFQDQLISGSVSAADTGGNENTAESVKTNRQWQPPARPFPSQ